MSFEMFRRSIVGIGSDRNLNQVHSMDVNGDSGSESHCELGSFEHLVFRRFHALSAASSDELLSLNWVSKLLDAFIACQEDFKVILLKNESNLLNTTLDRFVTEFFDMNIKALDTCNAVRDGVEKVRVWYKRLEIVLGAFDSNSRNVMVEAQFRRAKKGLTDLAMIMLDDDKGKDNQQKPGHSRSISSISRSVPNSWSASKQLQLMANGLSPPRGHEISAANGLANNIYTMSFVLMFVLWTLVSAIPCQDRGLQVHFSVPRQFSWGTPLSLLHSRITDESKKRERKNSVGLLKELEQMEKSIHLVTGLVDSVNQFPLTDEQNEVKTVVQEVARVCNTLKNGLDPLERQLREVFHKIMACRTQGLEILGRAKS